MDKKTKRKSKKPPQFAKAGMVVTALLETSAPICIETFKDFKQLGRFTLRDEGESYLRVISHNTEMHIGRTVAIGKVTKLVEKEDMPDVAALNVAAGGA
jgi:peptide chain release factor subunit 3